MAKILVVDDEETIRKLLTTAIQRQGHEVVCVEDGYRALEVFKVFQPIAIVSDIKMPKMTGFQMWEDLKKTYKTTPPIIFITGHGEKSAAIESLRMGAFDYLEKPFDMDDFTYRLEAAVKRANLENENQKLSADLATANEKLKEKLEARTELVHRIQHENPYYSLDMLGSSSSITPLKNTISQLTKSPMGSEVGILITGASGSGKEVAARLIHELSARSKGPWVPVNCGALPETLVESELFGHEKGAFTGASGRKMGVFELADGGTLFLDEIGELPLNMQTKLLRALQEKSFRRVGGSEEIKVDVRVVAATNKDLKKAIAEKSFREDLFYRLNTVQLQVPSLKERKEDIPLFSKTILAQLGKGIPKAPKEFLSDCFQLLNAHDWPGNLRELKSVIQRAALITQGPVVTPESVANALGVAHATPLRKTPSLTLAATDATATNATVQTAVPATAPSQSTATGIPYHTWKKQYMQGMEREYLQQQLSHFHGNVSALSRFMKVSRPNLCRLLKKHGLHAEEYRDHTTTSPATAKVA
jgi:DNA-binding NtrC family response regulator